MSKQETIIAKTTGPSRLLSGSATHEAHYRDGVLTLLDHAGHTTHRVATNHLRASEISRGLLHNSITLTTTWGETVKVGGLPKRESEDIFQFLRQAVEEAKNREAAENAATLTPKIASLNATISELLTDDRYIRHSETTWIPEAARQLAEECDQRTEQRIEKHIKSALAQLRKATDPDELEIYRKTLNGRYLKRAESLVQDTAGDILSTRLTEEQAQAIATDEDCTLVLAGAGTGKTAVIIGKIAHLVRNQGVEPSSILALAFNRKAALEIRERMPSDLKGVNISTFHSYGRKVIAEQGVAPTISTLATDNLAYLRAMNEIVHEMLHDPDLSRTVLDLGSMPAEYRSPFDFEDPSEYKQYVKDVELRTLRGHLVKSFEELTIANFLSENGIEFQYEAPYEVRTATNEYRQYQPDFHIPHQNIYIEHFAINERGEAPPGWDRYVTNMEWKRQTHHEHGTTLVETYSWQHREGTLLETLQTNLEKRGVEFNPVPTEELVQRLSEERINLLAHLLGAFIHHLKSGNLPREEIESRAQKSQSSERARKFLRVFHAARERYQQLLTQEKAIDFHDLINQAVDIMREEGWTNPFTHVLVDELQDLSQGRMTLLEALRKEGLAYFLVGDDWQSIYRFAGSQVGLIHDCDQHLGYTERMVLTRTFRFGRRILAPSSRFVQKNPEQTKRELTTDGEGDGIILMASLNQQEGLNWAIQEILEKNQGQSPGIMVLGRYRGRNSTIRELQHRIPTPLEFSTAHAAKGRESEYVIILDLSDGRYGFPCRAEDDPLLELVLPPIQGQAFPHAEERRLFYVAITRAIRSAYLIADARNPSPFIRELLEDSPEVENRGNLAPPCPDCPRGSLTPSTSGKNLRCSNFPMCEHLAPRCPGCRKGYVTIKKREAECSNPVCQEPPKVCPGCHRGILIPKTGHTAFWGCNRYHAAPSCRYTTPRNTDGSTTTHHNTDNKSEP